MDCMQYVNWVPCRCYYCFVSIPQAVWIACNVTCALACFEHDIVSIPQAVWIACNPNWMSILARVMVSIPQAVWIACNWVFAHSPNPNIWLFQYRKRYGLHAIRKLVSSDMSNYVSIPQAVWIACNWEGKESHSPASGFNTASGMDCMQ